MDEIKEVDLRLNKETINYLNWIKFLTSPSYLDQILGINKKEMIKEGIHINGIYQHYKGDFYKVEEVAHHHEDATPVVVYSKCNQHGIYLSIRDKEGNPRVKQPFYRNLIEFNQFVTPEGNGGFSWKAYLGFKTKVPRFKFTKHG